MTSLSDTQLKHRVAKVQANRKIVSREEYEGTSPIKTVVKSAKTTKGTKKSGKKTGKKLSIGKAIFQLFNCKGVDKASYDEGLKIAKEIKPDTKFNKAHWAWYKGAFKKQQ